MKRREKSVSQRSQCGIPVTRLCPFPSERPPSSGVLASSVSFNSFPSMMPNSCLPFNSRLFNNLLLVLEPHVSSFTPKLLLYSLGRPRKSLLYAERQVRPPRSTPRDAFTSLVETTVRNGPNRRLRCLYKPLPTTFPHIPISSPPYIHPV